MADSVTPAPALGAPDLPLAIALMGPTASGKTAVAVELCERLPVEIVSVDSAQVYRGLDIGTAKPDAATLARAPHRLIDIRDPGEVYSAAQFRTDALAAMAAISAAGRIPLLVGGTMLYFQALLFGLSELPPADPAIRRQIDEEAAARGWEALHGELAVVDPAAAARIHPGDPQRLQRALEVWRATGRPLSDWQRRGAARQKEPWPQPAADLPCRVLQLAIAPGDRAVLHERIAGRFEAMVAAGLVGEVQALLDAGVDSGAPALRSVGYRQVCDYLAGELNREQMIQRGIVATRQLAKRQLTWLRSWRQVNRILTDRVNQAVIGPASVAGRKPADAVLWYLRRERG